MVTLVSLIIGYFPLFGSVPHIQVVQQVPSTTLVLRDSCNNISITVRYLIAQRDEGAPGPHACRGVGYALSLRYRGGEAQLGGMLAPTQSDAAAKIHACITINLIAEPHLFRSQAPNTFQTAREILHGVSLNYLNHGWTGLYVA